MWNPPPHVTEHQGDPIAPASDFFADPPPDIGPIRTAHTSLRRGRLPKSTARRLTIALAWGAGLEILLVALDLTSDHILGRTDLPFPVVVLPIAFLAGFIAWRRTRFGYICNYVGVDGCAQFSCKGSRAHISGRSLLYFKNTTSLVTNLTDHYKNSAYTHTTYGFSWYSSQLAEPVFGIAGSHRSRVGKPPTADAYNFCRSAESAWYQHLAPLMEAELAQNGRVSFSTGHNGWTALGPGFIEISDRAGKVIRLTAAEIGKASILNRILEIARPGVAFTPLDFAGGRRDSREGVYRFDLTVHNAPMFRYLFKRCLGVHI